MKDSDFDRLVKSVKQAGQIKRGTTTSKPGHGVRSGRC